MQLPLNVCANSRCSNMRGPGNFPLMGKLYVQLTNILWYILNHFRMIDNT